MRPQDFLDPMAAGFMTMPPLVFLNGDKPIQGSNQFLEVVWIWAEGAAAVNPDRPPHSHEFDEVFIFLGSNCEDPDDLGGEVEFWLGEGEDTEKYRFTTSTCIFVPRGAGAPADDFQGGKKAVPAGDDGGQYGPGAGQGQGPQEAGISFPSCRR